MPTLANMKLPPPKDWAEFEDITLTAMKLKWDSPMLQKNGRQGQPQAGVDIFGPDNLGRPCGIQCKLTDEELTLKAVEAEVLKAELFEPHLEAFYVATTAPRDATLQREVRLLTERRRSDHKFPVGLLFWDDLTSELVKNKAEFQKHYPQINPPGEEKATGAELLSTFDIAYFGLYVKDYMELLFGEFGQLAQEDPNQFETLMRTVEGCSLVLMPAARSQELTLASRELVRQTLAMVYGREKVDWAVPNQNASIVVALVDSMQYQFKGRQLAAFALGRLLGHWLHAEVHKSDLAGMYEPDLMALSAKLVPANVLEQIAGEVLKYKEKDSVTNANTPSVIYALVRRSLRDEAINS